MVFCVIICMWYLMFIFFWMVLIFIGELLLIYFFVIWFDCYV